MFGIGLIVLVICLVVNNFWNFNLSVKTNLFGNFERAVGLIFPVERMGDNDLGAIQSYRYLLDKFPKNVHFDGVTENIYVPLFEDSEHLTHIRLYRPQVANAGDRLPPVIVYFHGGGFVIGSVESTEHITTALANQTGFVVASVEYRLAPEHKFPAAALDSIAATKYVYDHADELGVSRDAFIVAGDSAGGTLAALVTQKYPEIVKTQLLIYPAVASASQISSSALENFDGYMLSLKKMNWFYLRYFGSFKDMKSPLACPLIGLQPGLPPAIVVTAEYDILRDEGEAYANAMKEVGVDVELIRYNNSVHAFFGLPWLSNGPEALTEIAGKIKAKFSYP